MRYQYTNACEPACRQAGDTNKIRMGKTVLLVCYSYISIVDIIGMKKITVSKSDEVAIIVEKMIEAEDDEITLSIPRFSHISESLSNFYLLKREADALSKKISVESIDDRVIELAEMSGLIGTNPFFAKNKRQFSDIVAPRSSSKSAAQKVRVGKLVKKPVEVQIPNEDVDENEEVRPILRRLPVEEYPAAVPKKINPLSSFEIPKLSLPEVSMPEIRFSKKWAYVLAVLVVLSGFGYAAAKVLPSAEVKITAIKKEWAYNNSITVDKAATLDIKSMSVPGQVFSEPGNETKRFPATGRRQVEKHAVGTMTVYNSYSSDAQQLVEKTRFMAPDGKLFRLTKTITVPGAKIVDGKIVPSNITADVIADVAGPDYNIGPVKLFTIPGFKGSPKYQSFYGETTSDMTGGFIGEIAYPTSDDIIKAKNAAGSDLESALNTKLLMQVPKEFKILDGTRTYRVISQKADEEADADGNFGILTEGRSTIIAFRESDMLELLKKKSLSDESENFEVRSHTLEYGIARVDFDKGRMTFPVDYKSVLARKIDAEALKGKILGKSEAELKQMVFELSGLESATISLWPFWVKTVPNNLNKITVIVE